MINKKRLTKLIQKLISIDSQNPPGNESEIVRFVESYLKGFGIKSRIVEFRKNRPNLIAVIKGKNKEHSILITPHLDTVPAGRGWKFGAFSGKIHKGRVYGLGATDCKGNLASAIETICSLAEDNVQPKCDLIFAATSDEETGSHLGLIPLIEKGVLKPDEAVVLDAEDFAIVVAQKGLIHLKVKIRGRRAHGAYPWLGENAIDIAVKIISQLKAQKIRSSKNKYLYPATVNVGTIRGGDKVNIVADWCEFELDFRFLPGMSAQKIIKSLKSIISRYTRKYAIDIQSIQQPYVINKDHRLVSGLSWAMRKNKIRPQVKGSEGATVITFFQDKKIPAIATGFGQNGCFHVVNEYAKIDSLYKGSKILEDFLKP
ncbi:MAG: M20 family metallopeptidase [Candidatus Omnitrophica bacterium]|nr:M20 family metallopeptidase [Candidatus Omnitrophota bacterium]